MSDTSTLNDVDPEFVVLRDGIAAVIATVDRGTRCTVTDAATLGYRQHADAVLVYLNTYAEQDHTDDDLSDPVVDATTAPEPVAVEPDGGWPERDLTDATVDGGPFGDQIPESPESIAAAEAELESPLTDDHDLVAPDLEEIDGVGETPIVDAPKPKRGKATGG